MTSSVDEVHQRALDLTKRVVQSALRQILAREGIRYDQLFVRVKSFVKNSYGSAEVTVLYGDQMQYFVIGNAALNEDWNAVTVDLHGSAQLHIEGKWSKLRLGLHEWTMTENN